MAHQLPQLPYDYDVLEPHIDERTMRIHHDKHHQGYVDKLNAALEGYEELQEKSVEQLLRDIAEVPEDIKQAVINHGGGHANHSLFWTVMSPDGGGEPTGEVADAIAGTFGDFAAFQEQFTDTALGRFGSGWGWLVVTSAGDLKVYSTANQDSPHMEGDMPILGVDVWEHAYYLNYQNKRAEYLKAWWNVVNWNEVNRRFIAAREQ